MPGAVSLPALMAVCISWTVKGMSASANVLVASVMNQSLYGLRVLSLWMIDLLMYIRVSSGFEGCDEVVSNTLCLRMTRLFFVFSRGDA